MRLRATVQLSMLKHVSVSETKISLFEGVEVGSSTASVLVTATKRSIVDNATSGIRGVIARLKTKAVSRSGDTVAALKSCSQKPIVRERPGA